jgi:hypothetical protein
MALALYRRHRRDCKAHHPEELRTSEYDERKKGYKRCECPIFASGTLAKRFRRQSTGRWEWAHAKALAAQWELAGTWTGVGATLPAPAPDPAPQTSSRCTIVEATEAFLSHRRNRGVAPATLAKYRTFTRQVRDYADSRGYVFMDLWFANNRSANNLLCSNTFITVVESAELWNGNDLSVAQRLSRKRTLFAEAQMGPRIVVVAEITRQRSFEMARIQNDVVVQTLPANGSD